VRCVVYGLTADITAEHNQAAVLLDSACPGICLCRETSRAGDTGSCSGSAADCGTEGRRRSLDRQMATARVRLSTLHSGGRFYLPQLGGQRHSQRSLAALAGRTRRQAECCVLRAHVATKRPPPSQLQRWSGWFCRPLALTSLLSAARGTPSTCHESLVSSQSLLTLPR